MSINLGRHLKWRGIARNTRQSADCQPMTPSRLGGQPQPKDVHKVDQHHARHEHERDRMWPFFERAFAAAYSLEQRKEIQCAYWHSETSSARDLLEQAIRSRDWSAVDSACAYHRVVWQMYSRLERARSDGRFGGTLQKRRQAGKKAKGVKRVSGHDWDAICQEYDTLMKQGLARPAIIRKLSSPQRHDIRQDVLNRGLRKRGRGSTPRK